MKQLKISQSITTRDAASVSKYLSEISKIPLISAEEEIDLAHKIQEGDLDALEALTSANLRFVVSVAKQYQNNGLPLSDLINEGNIGLIKAAKRFDPSKGFKFISYAVWWIRQSIIQAIVERSKLVRIPVNKSARLTKVMANYTQFVQEYEREPSIAELADASDLTTSQLETVWNNHIPHSSMDAPIGGQDNHLTMLDLMPDDGDAPDVQLMEESLQVEIASGLRRLSPREVEVLSRYYGLNGYQAHSLLEVANKLNLSKERIRQIRDRAIMRLRRIVNGPGHFPEHRF